ncbi:jhy protein homolog [Eudromia elegans]
MAFMQAHPDPANLESAPVSEGDLAAGLRASDESDFESLAQESQYQLELQRRIQENDELVGLSSEEFENDSLEEGLEETRVQGQEGATCDTGRDAAGMQSACSNGRKHQSADKYFNLRYNPNWKNMKGIAELSEVKKAHQVTSRDSVELSQDSFYLPPNNCPKEKTQQMAKSQESSPDLDPQVFNFHKPNATVSKKPFRLHVKGKASETDCHFKPGPSTFSSAFSLRIQDQPERTKKNFVAKNKRTLGLGTRAGNSYLQIHCKKQGEDLQEQVEDSEAVDEEPVHNVAPYQTMKMDPEEKWYLKSQQLKLGSGSELNAERGQGSQVKISRSNSEGYLMQLEKQNQPKVNKKLYRSKAYYTSPNVRLGGLGPDYEAVKDKKEKLRQQKEYAKQVKEYNMKSMTCIERLPAKPNVTSSVSRQKALEYAKKIPRPKTFVTRQPEEEVKYENNLSQVLRRNHLPQIASLETLQERHEKEKQVVAAFRTLHIL